MLRFMPAPDTNWAVKLDVGLAWCARVSHPGGGGPSNSVPFRQLAA